jgi:hypothetical protein
MPGEGHRWLAYAHELGSVLPDFEPDAEMARRCLAIANRVFAAATRLLSPA